VAAVALALALTGQPGRDQPVKSPSPSAAASRAAAEAMRSVCMRLRPPRPNAPWEAIVEALEPCDDMLPAALLRTPGLREMESLFPQQHANKLELQARLGWTEAASYAAYSAASLYPDL
jgi:hypothetical protein